jgi:class 3 adenylate cyclase
VRLLQMQKTLTFDKPSGILSYERELKWQFPFLMVDSSLIGAPEEMSSTSPHFIMVTVTEELALSWGFYRPNGTDAQADIDRANLLKIAFEYGKRYVKKKVKETGSLERTEKLDLTTKTAEMPYLFDPSRVKAPNDSKIVEEVVIDDIQGKLAQRAMKETKRITSMLFSDIKGYSKIKNDDLKVKLVREFNEDIIAHVLKPSNHYYYNTWGDAFYICSDNPVALAEIALEMRDKARNKNWQQFGLSENLAIRIALHAQSARILMGPDGEVSNVVGMGVDTAARIEPITDPNEVFCSKIFYDLLLTESANNIRGIPIGRKKLAKDFGEADLYRLIWSSELLEKQSEIRLQSSIPMPKVKGGVTDKQRADFLLQAFDFIKAYFERALNQFSSTQADIETSFRPVSNMKFVSEIYRNGKAVRVCKIWINVSGLPDNYIRYSDDRHSLDSDQTYNEALQVKDDDSQVYLEPFPMLSFGLGFQVKNKLTPEEAAEYLWKRLVLPLEH